MQMYTIQKHYFKVLFKKVDDGVVWGFPQDRQNLYTWDCSPATPAEDMWTAPLLGTNSPLNISLDFEYAAK